MSSSTPTSCATSSSRASARRRALSILTGLRAARISARCLCCLHLGLIDYSFAHCLQRRLNRLRICGLIPDLIITCEHPAVVTAGREATPAEVAAARRALAPRGVPVVPCERGGRLTAHMPGQLLVYAVVHLDLLGRDLHRLPRWLEQAAIEVCSRWGLVLERGPQPGLWSADGRRRAKVASIGLWVRRWVSMHGLALNVDCDLSILRCFMPCGLSPAHYGRLADFASPPPIAVLARDIASELAKLAGVHLFDISAQARCLDEARLAWG